jgi:hypothetical protein
MTEYERSGLVVKKTRVYKFGHRIVLQQRQLLHLVSQILYVLTCIEQM